MNRLRSGLNTLCGWLYPHSCIFNPSGTCTAASEILYVKEAPVSLQQYSCHMPALSLFSVFTVVADGEMGFGFFFFYLSSQDFSLFMVLLHYSALNRECCRAQRCAPTKRCSPTPNPNIALGKSHSPRAKWAKCCFSSSALLTTRAVLALSLSEHEV